MEKFKYTKRAVQIIADAVHFPVVHEPGQLKEFISELVGMVLLLELREIPNDESNPTINAMIDTHRLRADLALRELILTKTENQSLQKRIEDFEKESIFFKTDKLAMEHRIEDLERQLIKTS